MTVCYNNDWFLKRPRSDMDILSVDTENHFDNCVRGGDSRMKQDGDDVCHIPKFSTFENSTSILTLSTAEKSNAGNSNSEGFRKKKQKKRQKKKKIEEKEKDREQQKQNNNRISHIAAEQYIIDNTSLLKQRTISVLYIHQQSQYTTQYNNGQLYNLSSYRIHSGINTIRYKYYVSSSSLSPKLQNIQNILIT